MLGQGHQEIRHNEKFQRYESPFSCTADMLVNPPLTPQVTQFPSQLSVSMHCSVNSGAAKLAIGRSLFRLGFFSQYPRFTIEKYSISLSPNVAKQQMTNFNPWPLSNVYKITGKGGLKFQKDHQKHIIPKLSFLEMPSF